MSDAPDEVTRLRGLNDFLLDKVGRLEAKLTAIQKLVEEQKANKPDLNDMMSDEEVYFESALRKLHAEIEK